MITFCTSAVCLVLGYLFYGKFLAKYFGVSPENKTPVQRLADGVDYIEIRPWKAFMIQLLNIAGLGPIFGAILGAAYGPVAYIWIVLGCIFMGAAHDFFSGVASMRNNGAGLPDLVGKYLGKNWQKFLVLFSALMLLAVGIAFVSGPAGLLAAKTAQFTQDVPADAVVSAAGISLPLFGKLSWLSFWTGAIIAYFILAVLLPINKIIGRIYPFFGAALIFMALGVAGAMIWNALTGTITMPELTLSTLQNFHPAPDVNHLFPMLFIVISCGAISGFHATQSPMIARCLKSETSARAVFYGAMIAEGLIALIWATAAIAYCGGVEQMNASGAAPAVIVNNICTDWLGTAGAILAIVGVIACPITSGDTALRSVRLIVADAFKIRQKPMLNRVLVSLPVFVVALLLSHLSFDVIWRYVGVANQTLAAITLWAGAVWLARERKLHWILSVPAAFLSAVCISYFLTAPNLVGGLALPYTFSWIFGVAFAAVALAVFALRAGKNVAHEIDSAETAAIPVPVPETVKINSVSSSKADIDALAPADGNVPVKARNATSPLT